MSASASPLPPLDKPILHDLPVVHVGGLYRFVDHARGLLTTGFGSERSLRRNADIIRTEGPALQLMRERYAATFPPRG